MMFAPSYRMKEQESGRKRKREQIAFYFSIVQFDSCRYCRFLLDFLYAMASWCIKCIMYILYNVLICATTMHGWTVMLLCIEHIIIGRLHTDTHKVDKPFLQYSLNIHRQYIIWYFIWTLQFYMLTIGNFRLFCLFLLFPYVLNSLWTNLPSPCIE